MICLMKKISRKDVLIGILIIVIILFLIIFIKDIVKGTQSVRYSVSGNDGLRVGYSIDIVDKTAIEYEITPEVAAYIAKGVFVNIHGEKYVEERELKVFENTQLLSDVEKYGEFYTVSLNHEGYTDGEFIAISKIDGRILKVYWFG